MSSSAWRSYLTSPTIGEWASIQKSPALSSYTVVCGQALDDCGRASNLSCLHVQMKQPALANEPDLPMAIFDNVSDPPNKLASAVIAIMCKGFRRRVKPVQAAVFGEPQIAATVAGDAPNCIAAKAVGVVGVVKVAGTTFGCGVEFVYAGMSSNPQITTIVFYQIPNEVVA